MTKVELRKIYKERRKQLSAQQIEKFTDCILINFQKIQLPFISYMHTYIASEKLREADTSAIAQYLQFKNPGLIILVPKIDMTSGGMQHIHFHEDTALKYNLNGIGEPVEGKLYDANEIDLALVPLLAFDEKGYRVGYGKGYYDKFLSQCKDDVIKIGISFFEPVRKIEDVNQYDIPLNYCVTPKMVYEFF